ncbi:MAG TPA: lmo0937 family membrane protein [Gemmatimonadaceae bacterium]|nr:lmo0937 family membrane protein [Gemmatimonadaceae bacterium]
MFLVIACILFVLWLLAVVAFRMTKGIIHLVLLIAIIAVVIHFVRGRH